MSATPDLASELGIHPELHPLWRSLSAAEQHALALVWLAQQGHGWDLAAPANRRQAIRWWSEFLPSRVVLAARTCSSLGEWCSALCARLRGQMGAKGEDGFRHREILARLLAIGESEQRAVLDVLERQAQVLVTMVRADQDLKRREKFGDSRYGKSESKNEDGAADGTGGGTGAGRSDPDLFGGNDGTGGVPASAETGVAY